VNEKEYSNVFFIPANYTDSGKLFGGMLETRNTIETGILIVLLGYPELMWLPVPATMKIVIMTITILPLGIVGLMGIGGDSLMQYLSHIVKFWVRRRHLHFRRIGYHYDRVKNKKGARRKKRKR